MERVDRDIAQLTVFNQGVGSNKLGAAIDDDDSDDYCDENEDPNTKHKSKVTSPKTSKQKKPTKFKGVTSVS